MNRGIGMNKKIISIIYIIFLLFILILVVYPFDIEPKSIFKLALDCDENLTIAKIKETQSITIK